MMHLETVDTDVANLFDTVGELHVNGIAVDDANHRALDRGAGIGAAGTEQRHEQQQRKPPSRGRDAATVSPRIGTCQDLETEATVSERGQVREAGYWTRNMA
jgi:hypothetical protein